MKNRKVSPIVKLVRALRGRKVNIHLEEGGGYR